jgi:hypothetical protein
MNIEVSEFVRRNSRAHVFASTIFILLLFMFTADVDAKAQLPTYWVCNRGTIPVHVASLSTHIYFFDRIWMLDGWYKAEPNGACVDVGRFGISHLVFSVSNSDEWGVVKYNFDTEGAGDFAVQNICVKPTRMQFESKSVNYLPPCPDGFIAVPTSLSLYYGGGDVTLNLTVHPSPNDFNRIAVHLIKPKQPVAPQPADSTDSQKPKPVSRKSTVRKRKKPANPKRNE